VTHARRVGPVKPIVIEVASSTRTNSSARRATLRAEASLGLARFARIHDTVVAGLDPARRHARHAPLGSLTAAPRPLLSP
jgi:hypothetical protein